MLELTHSQTLKQSQVQSQMIWLRQELAIPVMQVSIAELEDLAAKELEENPELLREEPVEESVEDAPEEQLGDAEFQDWAEELDRMGLDSTDDWGTYSARSQRKDPWSQDADSSYYENTLTETESLYRFLYKELYHSFLSEGDKKIAFAMVEEIDERGFLSVSLGPFAHEHNVDLERVEMILAVIQEAGPVGVGARSLQECYLLQLRQLGKSAQLAEVIVSVHWEELKSGRISRIANSLATSVVAVENALAMIARLDASPGRTYASQEAAIVPDAYIRPADDGDWLVTVNKGENLSLRVNSDSLDEYASKEAVSFYRELRQNANSFIEMIEFRHKTLLQVVSAIVDRQKAYLENGDEFLVPMTQSELAKEFDLSEATLSRMVNNKYVQTPNGTVPLKFFFDSGVSTFKGNSLAAKAVKARIRKLVAKEDKAKPLSDQALTNHLVIQGIDISCRGVNKYRQDMLIGSTRERKWA